MKILMITLFALFLGITSFICSNSNTNVNNIQKTEMIVSDNISAEETINEYFKHSRDNNFSELKELIISVPKSYEDFLRNSVPETEKEKQIRKKIQDLNLPDKIGNNEIIDHKYEYNYLTYELPVDIQKLNYQIVKFELVKIKGNDGKVLVKYKSDRHKGLIEEECFYVHREQGKWKIFMAKSWLFKADFPE